MSKHKEGKVEHYLVRRVGELGGLTRKIQYQNRSGALDRIVILPGGQVLFVECKALDGSLSPQQEHEVRTLLAGGAHAYVIATRDEVDWMLAREAA